MRCLVRWLLNLLTAFSLLLFVATVALWVRSYYAVDGVAKARGQTAIGIESRHGMLVLVRYDYSARLQPPPGWTFASSARLGWLVKFNGVQLALSPYFSGQKAFTRDEQLVWDSWGNTVRTTGFQIPYWALTAASSVTSAMALIGVIRRRIRLRSGTCVNCSYDLTGNVSGVCPECGAKMAK